MKRRLKIVFLICISLLISIQALAATITIDLEATLWVPGGVEDYSDSFATDDQISISFELDGTDLHADPNRFLSTLSGLLEMNLNGIDYSGSTSTLLMADHWYQPTVDSYGYFNATSNILIDDYTLRSFSFGSLNVDFSGIDVNDMQYEEDYEYLMDEMVDAMLNSGDRLRIQMYDEVERYQYSSWHNLYATVNSVNYTITGAENRDLAPAPEPSTMVLLGIGLLGLAGVNRRKK